MQQFKRTELESIFYNKGYFNSSFIRSKKATWNCILSDRSDGKTFDCKIQALIDFLVDDKAHIYARRYDTEFTTIMKQTFMKKLIRLYPVINEWCDFLYDDIGLKAKLKDEEESKFRYIVYFIPLSMSGKLKSQIEDERIISIDYDEYIPLDGKYLKHEMKYCCELYKTVDRDRDEVQFCIFGNKITSFNPFFDFFNLSLTIEKDKIKTYKDDTVAVQIYHSKILMDKRSKSKFSKSVEGTTYEDYDKGGILQKNEIMYADTKNTKFYVSFKTQLGEGSIWIKDNGYYVVSTKRYGQDLIVTDTNYKLDRPSIQCLAGNVSQVFKKLYRLNLLLYDSERAFYIFEPILKKINLN